VLLIYKSRKSLGSDRGKKTFSNHYINICYIEQTVLVITDMDDYIEFYNHQRFHETLKYKKPMDVYQESIKFNQEMKKSSNIYSKDIK
jgi:hypothetical protein